VDQIVGPLDAGAEACRVLYGVAHGNGGGAGQVHQLGRRAMGPQDHAHIDARTGGGEEGPAPSAPAPGLMVGHQNSAVRGTLGRQNLGLCIGGIDGIEIKDGSMQRGIQIR